VPSQYPTIQAAIDDCNNGDTVIVVEGTYTGTGNKNLDYGGKAITIRSTDPNDPNVVLATVIDCENSGRGFYFHSGEEANSIVSGLRITNGYVLKANGGGICCIGSSPTIEKCVIMDNRVQGSDCFYPGGSGCSVYGGGVYCASSNAVIIGCRISNNTTSGGDADGAEIDAGHAYGGGIYGSNNSYLKIDRCTITGNIASGGTSEMGSSGAGHGGGIYGKLTVTNTVLKDNYAKSFYAGNGAYGGGGYFLQNSSIINCLITGNKTCCENSRGGGIYGTGDLYIANCRLMDNWTPRDGGGMYLKYGLVKVVNCLFSGNESFDHGGGIYADSADTTITNCTITENRAPGGRGGGINTGASSTIRNSIIWNNECYKGYTDTEIYGSPIVTYSDIKGNWPGTGNINVDPCFVEPGYWDDNNTPTNIGDDFWIGGDYHLSQMAAGQASDSPCVDAGSDLAANLGMNICTTRTDHVSDAVIIDMGYHYGSCCLVQVNAADINGQGGVDFIDYAILTSQWKETPGIPSADIAPPCGDDIVDGKDLALLVDSWLWGK
jgi:predicted outer membrane repeat protein